MGTFCKHQGTHPLLKLAVLKPIVILDSGSGGLTVFDEITRIMPWLPVVYCADNGGFPYGPKSEQEVTERVRQLLDSLYTRYDPALVVVACNTASTIVLNAVRALLPIPVVGVVPAIKTAATLSRNRCIGLLATPGTVNRAYTDQLIQDFASDCDVIRVGSTELVHLAERVFRGGAVDIARFEQILAPFKEAHLQPDHIVLGCTHFPLVRHQLSICMPRVVFVDSGEAIARRVLSILEGQQGLIVPDCNMNCEKPIFIAHLTAMDDNQADFVAAIAPRGFQRVSVL